MIDLGDELAGYGDTGEPPRPARPAQPIPTRNPDGSATIPLADLQAAGFNRTPPDAGLGGLMSKMLLSNALFDDLFAEPVEPPDCLKAKPPAPAAIGIEPIYLGDRMYPQTVPPWVVLDEPYPFEAEVDEEVDGDA